MPGNIKKQMPWWGKRGRGGGGGGAEKREKETNQKEQKREAVRYGSGVRTAL